MCGQRRGKYSTRVSAGGPRIILRAYVIAISTSVGHPTNPTVTDVRFPSHRKQNTLAFDAMDSFMSVILKSIREDGARAVRVFPPSAGVLVQFASRVANEVVRMAYSYILSVKGSPCCSQVSEYIMPLLTRARQLPTPTAAQTYLQAVAASFNEAWKIVPAVLEVAQAERFGEPMEGKGSTEDAGVSKEAAEDVVYRMFEPNMDEYLDEEVECVKHALEEICKKWDKKVWSVV